MAKLRMPAGGLKTGEITLIGAHEKDENGNVVESSADVATALLEGDEVDEGESESEGDPDFGTGVALPEELQAELVAHDLFKNGDEDAPRQILDMNGDVVLAMCRRCGQAESELAKWCPVIPEPEIADADVPTVPPVEGELQAEAVATEGEQTVIAEEVQQDQPGDGGTVATDSAAVEAAAAPAVGPLTFVSEQARMRYERERAFRNWLEDCATAKEKFVAAALAHADLKAATKIAKTEEEDTMEAYAKLKKQNPLDMPYIPTASAMNTRPIALPSHDEPTAAEQETATLAESSSETAAQPTVARITDWQSVSITALEGLSDKLIERLQEDGIDTMGQLEARRGEISEGKAKWPKGIGEVKITAIEDAVIDWLTENRDRQVFTELESGHVSEQEEEAAESPAEAADAMPGDASAVDESDVEATKFTDAINARAIELDTGDEGSLDEVLKAGYWDRGYEHYQAGGELRDCGLPESPAQDDFIRGWLTAGKVADYEGATETAKAAEAIPSAASKLPQLVGLDEI